MSSLFSVSRALYLLLYVWLKVFFPPSIMSQLEAVSWGGQVSFTTRTMSASLPTLTDAGSCSWHLTSCSLCLNSFMTWLVVLCFSSHGIFYEYKMIMYSHHYWSSLAWFNWMIIFIQFSLNISNTVMMEVCLCLAQDTSFKELESIPWTSKSFASFFM